MKLVAFWRCNWMEPADSADSQQPLSSRSLPGGALTHLNRFFRPLNWSKLKAEHLIAGNLAGKSDTARYNVVHSKQIIGVEVSVKFIPVKRSSVTRKCGGAIDWLQLIREIFNSKDPKEQLWWWWGCPALSSHFQTILCLTDGPKHALDSTLLNLRCHASYGWNHFLWRVLGYSLLLTGMFIRP